MKSNKTSTAVNLKRYESRNGTVGVAPQQPNAQRPRRIEIQMRGENTEWNYCWEWWKRMNCSNRLTTHSSDTDHVLNSQPNTWGCRGLRTWMEIWLFSWNSAKIPGWSSEMMIWPSVTDFKVLNFPNTPVRSVVMKTQSTNKREYCTTVTRSCSLTTLPWVWLTITILT